MAENEFEFTLRFPKGKFEITEEPILCCPMCGSWVDDDTGICYECKEPVEGELCVTMKVTTYLPEKVLEIGYDKAPWIEMKGT